MRLKIMCGILLILVIVGMLSPCFVVHAALFSPGETVQVINCTRVGQPLRVRSSPSTSGGIIGYKNDGDPGMILTGPQSANGYNWWKVRWPDTGGLEGWSAEGDATDYYLMKVTMPTSTKFSIGDSVTVTGTGAYGLNVRNDPPDLLDTGTNVIDGKTGIVVADARAPFYGIANHTTTWGFHYFWKINYGTITGWSAQEWLEKPPSYTLTVGSAHDSPNPGVGSHTYSSGTSVTCSVTSPVTESGTVWSCTGWSGTGSVPSSGSGTSVTFTITQGSTITWIWPPVSPILTVSSAHDSPVPSNGPHSYSNGQSVTCSVTSPADLSGGSRYRCTGYTGTGSCPSGSGTSVIFTITQTSTITWNWVAQYSLTVSSAHDSPNPGVGTWWYDSGASLTCSVTSPAEGYSCTGWTGTGSVPSSGTATSTSSFIIIQGSTITWNWIVTPIGPFTLSVSSAHDSPNPSAGPHTYTAGQSVTCTVTSPVTEGGTSWTCTGWSGSGSVPASGSGTSVTFTITQDSTITWSWIVTPVSPTLTVSSAHDSPNPSNGAHSYSNGQSVTCIVTSPVTESGTVWTCSGWTGTGSVPSSGTGTSTTFTMTQNSSITWIWSTPGSFTLSVSSAHDSPVPSAGPHTYTAGQSVTCTVTSPVTESGTSWTCTGWSGSGSVPSSGTGKTVTFTITQDSTITWNWIVTPIGSFTLSVSSAHDSPVPSVGPHTYTSGTSVTCSVASPVTESGTVWTCSGWTGTGSVPSSGSGTSVTFTITQYSNIAWNWIQSQPADFSMTASTTQLKIQRGSMAASIITVTSKNGFNAPVRLEVTGKPSSVTADFYPVYVTPTQETPATSTLLVSVGKTATPGMSWQLIVTGNSVSGTHNLPISLEIGYLIAEAGPDQSVKSGDKVNFDGTNSGPLGTITKYKWDFTSKEGFNDVTLETKEGSRVEYRFRGAMNGQKVYTVTLTVEDYQGFKSTDTASVTVNPLTKLVNVDKGFFEDVDCWMRATYNWVGQDQTTGEDLYIISKIETNSANMIGDYQLFIMRRVGTAGNALHLVWNIPLPSPSKLRTYSTPFEPSVWQEIYGHPAELTALEYPDGLFEGIGVTDTSIMFIIASGGNLQLSITYLGPPIYFDIGITQFKPGYPIEHLKADEFSTIYKGLDVIKWLIKIPKYLGSIESPGEFRVYGSDGRVTGLVNGEVREEIPGSAYTGGLIVILWSSDFYRYEVVGAGQGEYGLSMVSLQEDSVANFTATAIPISPYGVHDYTIDWNMLSQGQEGVMVLVDSDGDHGWENIFFSDSELTRNEYVAATTKHDLGITGTTSLKSVTAEGYTLPINMTTINYGVYTETFNFAFYINTNLTEPRTVTLASGNSTAMTFTWNTTGLAYGNYTITAYVEPVLGETYVADNNVTWAVHVGVPGDISGLTLGVYDGTCDMRDISYLVTHFNPKPSSLDWDQNADINNDAKVNMRDISIAIINFNKHE